MAFAAAHEEAAAALSGTVICPLAHLGAIRASGAEAETFLQNQLSNDVRQLGASRVQLSSYNSAKGRVLDLFLLRRDGEAILLETRRETLPATLKRLRMFVLRSKLVLEDLGEHYTAFGLAGPRAAELLAQAGLPLPAQDWDWLAADGVTVLRRPGVTPRYSGHPRPGGIPGRAWWNRLATQARPVGSARPGACSTSSPACRRSVRKRPIISWRRCSISTGSARSASPRAATRARKSSPACTIWAI